MNSRTYKYFTGDPLYPFGHGLSYSQFEYCDLRISDTEFDKIEDLKVEVVVKNVSSRNGSEVVQLYLKDIVASSRIPNITLEGFKKITLKAGEEALVEFLLSAEQLAIINDNGNKVLEPGSFIVSVGGKQPGMKGNADNPSTQVIEEEIKYIGPIITLE
jgi:beta-glucosidase